jgi:hypothetical protein
MSRMHGKPACTRLWGKFVEHLGSDEKLARELWGKLYPSEVGDVMYALARIEDRGYHPEAIQRFGEVATPMLMLKLCERLAPETGQPRRRDVIALEGMILESTASKDGAWL